MTEGITHWNSGAHNDDLVLWDVTARILVKVNRRFGTYCIHIQCRIYARIEFVGKAAMFWTSILGAFGSILCRDM
jgi:hypothetical protein